MRLPFLRTNISKSCAVKRKRVVNASQSRKAEGPIHFGSQSPPPLSSIVVHWHFACRISRITIATSSVKTYSVESMLSCSLDGHKYPSTCRRFGFPHRFKRVTQEPRFLPMNIIFPNCGINKGRISNVLQLYFAIDVAYFMVSDFREGSWNGSRWILNLDPMLSAC